MLKRKVDLCEANSWNRCETQYFTAHSCCALSGSGVNLLFITAGLCCFQNSHDQGTGPFLTRPPLPTGLRGELLGREAACPFLCLTTSEAGTCGRLQTSFTQGHSCAPALGQEEAVACKCDLES